MTQQFSSSGSRSSKRVEFVAIAATLLVGGEALAQQLCADLTVSSPRITYVVSQTGGSDAVACSSNTETAPFATIPRALQCALPGDRILVKNGVYPRLVISGKQGAPTAWYSIEAFPGHTPILDGQNAVVDYNAILDIYNSRNVRVSGFEIMNTGASSPGGYGVRVDTSNEVVIAHNRVHEVWRTGVMAQNSNDVLIDGNEIFNTSMRNQNVSSTAGWSGGTSTHGGYATKCVSWLNNDIHDVWGECLDPVNVDTGTIRGNRVHDCFSVNIYLDSSKNYVVDGNYSYTTKTAFYRSGAPAAGIQIAKERTAGNAAQNITLSNNVIDGTGIRYWSGSDASAADVYGNLVIAHNVIRAFSGGYAITFDAPNADTTLMNSVVNNIVYGNLRFRTDDTENGVTRKVLWQVKSNLFPNGASIPTSTTTSGNVFYVDPMFVGPVVGQATSFFVRDGSPAIATGLSGFNAQVPRDYASVARNALTPSIGIDEHAGTQTLTASTTTTTSADAGTAVDAGSTSSPDAGTTTATTTTTTTSSPDAGTTSSPDAGTTTTTTKTKSHGRWSW